MDKEYRGEHVGARWEFKAKTARFFSVKSHVLANAEHLCEGWLIYGFML